MATSSAIHSEPVSGASAAKVDMKFEVIVIPVADVDARKRFKQSLGGGSMQNNVFPPDGCASVINCLCQVRMRRRVSNHPFSRL